MSEEDKKEILRRLTNGEAVEVNGRFYNIEFTNNEPRLISSGCVTSLKIDSNKKYYRYEVKPNAPI